jgi:pyrroloquinoline quinone biosynthesis protein D
MAPGEIPSLPRGVRLHFDTVRDTWVLLAPERAVTLDGIGHAILSNVDGNRSFGEITAHLSETFGAPLDQVTQDSAGFLGALRDRRFLDVVS